MPDHVPANVAKLLDPHQQRVWLSVFAVARKKYGEEKAYAIAMAAAKKVGKGRAKKAGDATTLAGPGGSEVTTGRGGGGGGGAAEAGQTALTCDDDQKGDGDMKVKGSQQEDDQLSDDPDGGFEDRSPHGRGDICQVDEPGHPCDGGKCTVMGQHPADPSKTRVRYHGKNPPQQTGSHKHKNLVTLKKAADSGGQLKRPRDATAVCVVEDMEFDDAAEMKITSDGYLACNPRVARTGVQLYKGAELGSNMAVVRVYRPEAEVFSDATIRSFSHRPVTNDHPPENVNAHNWKKYAIGHTADEVLRDGQFIRVPMLMMDQAAIRDIRSGKRQLSAGYSANLSWDAGETDDGEPYDAVQTGIRINHVALCKSARGGNKLCVGDSFRPLMEDEDHQHERRQRMLITVDSVQLDMEDIAASVVQRTITRLEGENKALKDAAGAFDTSSVELKRQIDTKDGEIVALKKQVSDAQLTPQKVDEMVRTRMEIVGRAGKILGSSFVTDGKTDVEIKRAVCVAKIGDAAVRAMNDDAINGAFSALTVASGSDGSRILATSFNPGNQPHSAQDAASIAYEERNKWLRDAHKQQRPQQQ